jgi:hypothetical protein
MSLVAEFFQTREIAPMAAKMCVKRVDATAESSKNQNQQERSSCVQ